MEPKDGKGPGDAPAPNTKRAPSARKRAPKAVKPAEQNGSSVAEREPRATPPAQDQADGTERSPKDTRDTKDTRNASVSTPRAADQADPTDTGFSNGDAERAATLAADLKSWMDTRQGDREVRGEVL